ncbi:ABC transporter substrate-binding protein [Streptosporangium saharense]|uniref:Peptide/nickel transport system substrate-binding protein/oligopeptide transport system substrate-binding protein n=1 Tax=Streptosporangium saharense TaxID=1706840 RepID=A0A7W7VRE5_9ACTN|nr:ABC transporter substrate-binding protein [Streptosporangium saharense]MBB4919992.1 peptide/nickel transport system substrate-binding protein/oligopeptide transport system substrate-binding protein [Streptosporangium saharense]
MARRRRSRIMFATATTVVALGAVAACGGVQRNAETPGAGPADGTPRAGGTMTVAYKSDPKTFDPAVCYDATCWNNMRMLYDRLYDYKGETSELVPQGAEAPPTVSPDGKTYTIRIRPGMTFSDGSPVTAKDFAYSFSRILDPATKSPVRGFWTGVAGAEEYGKKPEGTPKGIQVVSDSELRIELTQPNSAFKYILAMPHASVIPEGSGAEAATRPLGSGPFVFKEFSPGRQIVLEKNAKYWDKPRPYVDKVVELLGVNPDVALLQLEKGQIDLMGDPIPPAQYLSVTANAALKDQTVTIAKPSTYFLTLNVKMKPFDNPKVREAVSYAIDRAFLLKLVNGQGQVANEFLPPGVLGHTDDKLVHDQDVAKAKQLLAEAGYPDGFSTTLYSWNTPPWTNLLPQLQQDLAKIGVKAEPRPLQQSTFFELAGTPGKVPMALSFWVADYPEGSNFFQALTACAAAVQGGQNYAFSCDKETDDLVAKALATDSTQEAQRLYTEASTRLLAGNSLVPLYYGSKTEVFGKKVGGYFPQPVWAWDMTNYWKTDGKPLG